MNACVCAFLPASVFLYSLLCSWHFSLWCIHNGSNYRCRDTGQYVLGFFCCFFCCFWLAKKPHAISLRQFSKSMGFNCGLKKLLAWIGQNIKLINGWSLTFSLWLNPHRSVLTLWPPDQHCFCPHFLQIGPEALRTPLDPWRCSGIWHQDNCSRFFKFCKLWCRASRDQIYWSRAKRLAKTEIRGVYRSSQHL